MPKVLIVYDPPPPFGGVRVSAAQTTVLLRKLPGLEFTEMRFYSHPSRGIGFILQCLRGILSADAVLFLVGGFMDIAGTRPMVLIALAALFRKKIIFRGFGGGMEQEFASAAPRRKAVLIFAARMLDMITFQTKSDAAYFTGVLRRPERRIVWLPNTREANGMPRPMVDSARKFCFFGKVSKEKGVGIISEAKRGLPESISVDVYGELADGDEGSTLKARMEESGVRYKGVVAPERIPELLREYDCLLLPTTWRTEGYPGVVLEAFAAGIPVICTRWNALPELVDESCGILVAPNSAPELRNAIWGMHADAEGWKKMAAGAKNRIRDFNPVDWSSKLHGWIAEVVGGERAAAQAGLRLVAKEY